MMKTLWYSSTSTLRGNQGMTLTFRAILRSGTECSILTDWSLGMSFSSSNTPQSQHMLPINAVCSHAFTSTMSLLYKHPYKLPYNLYKQIQSNTKHTQATTDLLVLLRLPDNKLYYWPKLTGRNIAKQKFILLILALVWRNLQASNSTNNNNNWVCPQLTRPQRHHRL